MVLFLEGVPKDLFGGTPNREEETVFLLSTKIKLARKNNENLKRLESETLTDKRWNG